MSTTSGNKSLAEIVSAVHPVPPTVLATVAKTSYGQRYPDWATPAPWKYLPQIITALVLIQESPVGKAWGVSFASGSISASDTRYTAGCGGLVAEAMALVEKFFMVSGLSETAPMASVTWLAPEIVADHKNSGLGFSCNAILRMLYAAQKSRSPEIALNENDIAAMKKKIAELEAHTASLSLELKQVTEVKIRAPAVTCLMYLFAGYTNPTCSTCNPFISHTDFHSSHIPSQGAPGGSGGGSGGASGGGSGDDDAVGSTTGGADEGADEGADAVAHKSSSHTLPSFSIAPHTDRLSDLSLDAQIWFWQQLDKRSIWVQATSPDSYDNHISWTPFSGAVKMGKSVVFSYGNYRFW